MNDAVIHTGLYSDKAYELLNRLIKSVILYAKWSTKKKQIRSIIVDRAPDNEIVFTEDSQHECYYMTSVWTRTNDQALKWIAVQFRDFVRTCKKIRLPEDSAEDVCWRHDNESGKILLRATEPVTELKVSIRDICFIYDFFMRHKSLDKKYGTSLIDSYIGHPNDPVSTELEITKRQRIKELNDKVVEDCRRIRCEENQELDAVHRRWSEEADKIRENAAKKRAACREQFDVDLAALEREYAEMKLVSAL